MFDKINLVYRTFPHQGSPTFGTKGLENALSTVEKLNYAFDIAGNEILDVDKLQSHPILYMRGLMEGMGSFIEKGGKQFKAAYESESLYTRHGLVNYKNFREREKLFDLMFTVADSDLNSYSIPTIHCPPWANKNELFPIDVPGYTTEILFVGNRDGREDFLDQDTRGLIRVINTLEYNKALNTHLFCLNPVGRYYNGVCGRLWEILAAGSLCFQYYNPDTMNETLKGFEDGVNIVLFKDMKELYKKYDYYKEHQEEAMLIAKRGHELFLQAHTEIHRANFLANRILTKANNK